MKIKIRFNDTLVYIFLKRGGKRMRKNRSKSSRCGCSAQCAQHKPVVKTDAKPAVRFNSLGIPVISGGGKSMRAEYLDCK